MIKKIILKSFTLLAIIFLLVVLGIFSFAMNVAVLDIIYGEKVNINIKESVVSTEKIQNNG